ncbi:MAG: DUF2344 domain-containing protein [Cyanobacteria bacterium SIG30]|nr:DUF2344 domain-containing protein [Cyanobacteria bacterium SIG30]
MRAENYQYRIKITKLNELKFISHLDFQNLILKTLRRAKCELALSEGFSPSPKINFSPALPLFIESECELVNFACTKKISDNFKETFEKNTNKNMKIKEIYEYPPTDRRLESLDILIQWAKYEAELFENKKNVYDFEKIIYNVEKCLSNDNLFIKKINKKGIEKNVDFKPSVKDIKTDGNGKIIFTLKAGQGDVPALRADEFLKTIFKDDYKLFKIKRTHFFDKDLKVL